MHHKIHFVPLFWHLSLSFNYLYFIIYQSLYLGRFYKNNEALIMWHVSSVFAETGRQENQFFRGLCKSGRAQISGAQIFKVLMQNINISIMPLTGSRWSSFPGGEFLKPTCFAAKCRRIDAGSPEKSHSLKNKNKCEVVFVPKSIFILKSIFSTTTRAESLFLI